MRSWRPLHAAIVGAGLMGRWHADAVARAGGTVALIVDPDGRRAERLAARHPGSQAVADVSAANRGDAVDVVHLCTPSETHEALATQALEAGRHVLVEKPLAPTAATTAALLRRAELAGRLLCPVHQWLFQTGILRARRALGSISPLLHVETVACSAGADGRPDVERDRIAADILPHPLSLLARVLPTPLASIDWQVQHPLAGELRASGRAGTVSIALLVSMAGRPTTNALRLIGERGTVHVDLFHGFHVVEGGAVSRARKVAHPFLLSGATLRAAVTNLVTRAARREVAYPGLRELVRRFYRAVQRDGEPPIGARETLDVAAARDTLLGTL